jgi:hypothetical protein
MSGYRRGKYEDEGERQIRALGLLFRRKYKRASFGELSTFYTNCAVILVGCVAATIYWGQLTANIKSAEAARDAADIARQTLEVSSRPWVSASVDMEEPIKFTDAGASTTVSFSLRNVGHTPALETQYRADIVTLPEKTWQSVELRDAAKHECVPMLQRFIGSPHIFPAFFPGDSFKADWPASISRAGILNALKATEKGVLAHKGFVRLYLVACVDYQLSFGVEHHQTVYGFQLGTPVGDSGMWMSDVKPEGVHPEMKLIMLDSFAN